MRKPLTIAIAAAVLGISAGSADAASVDYNATCDSLTITAPAGARVLFGVDDEPPGEVVDGATTTVTLGMPVEVHTYVMFVMVDGVQTDIINGSVAACAEPEPMIAEEVAPVVAADPQPAFDVTSWEAVSLSPPW